MQLQIQDIVPAPLAGRMGMIQTDIWGKEQTIAGGEYVFLRAPSGRGKSTFIHILYGLRQDFEGRVLWDGKEGKAQAAAQWADWRSRELSIVFQDLRLFDDLTLLENLVIKQSLTATTPMDQVMGWLKDLELEGKAAQKAGTLSYGERQRVAIIRSLLQPFQWLLLDEPFSHLDDALAAKAATLIQDQVKVRHAGMILVDLEDNNWFPYTRKWLL